MHRARKALERRTGAQSTQLRLSKTFRLHPVRQLSVEPHCLCPRTLSTPCALLSTSTRSIKYHFDRRLIKTRPSWRPLASRSVCLNRATNVLSSSAPDLGNGHASTRAASMLLSAPLMIASQTPIPMSARAARLLIDSTRLQSSSLHTIWRLRRHRRRRSDRNRVKCA